MKAFVKTLIGDRWNASVVAAIVLAAYALIACGQAGIVPYLIPVATLAGVGFLVRH